MVTTLPLITLGSTPKKKSKRSRVRSTSKRSKRKKKKKKKSSILSSIARYGLIPATIGGNIITAGLEKITGKKYGRQTTKELSETKFGKVLGTATLGTAAALGVAVGGAAGTARAAKSLVPKSSIGKVVGLVGVGAAAASPTILKAGLEAPFTLVEAGEKLGEKVEALPEETKEEASKFGAAGLAAAAGVAAAAGIIGAAPAIIGKAKDLLPFGKGDKEDTPSLPMETMEVAEAPKMEEMPLTPETVDITKKPSTKRRSKAPQQKISQSVRVSVNQEQNKRYKNIILVS
jgi:hypothetical protein